MQPKNTENAEHADDQRKRRTEKRKIGKGGFVRNGFGRHGRNNVQVAAQIFGGGGGLVLSSRTVGWNFHRTEHVKTEHVQFWPLRVRFWQMFPCTNISFRSSFSAVLPWQKKAMIFDIPGPKNRGEGTFAKTTLLPNRSVVASRT